MNLRPTIKITGLAMMALMLIASVATAQFRNRSRSPSGQLPKTARETDQHSNETPNWTNAPGFKKDVWTFVRVAYHTQSRSYGFRYGGDGRWAIDYPDADLNISWRLSQMTSMKVDPDARVIELTDPALFRYPFIYMVEPGGLQINEDEVPILRRYLMNGGFLMFDDFWGEVQWSVMAGEMKKVFPERQWVELPRSHAVFHNVFDLPDELNLQCPNIRTGSQAATTGVTWEYHDGEECKPMHVRAIYDDKGRMMVIATHNTDNGDGWEREGENEYYFREFSEKKSYPLGINIFFYAMTH